MDKLFVANWKMTMPLEAAIRFGKQHFLALNQAVKEHQNELVICPSFVSLIPLRSAIEDCTSLFLGAQNCSSFDYGAYTGEISAESLAEIPCDYTIVGHSERRHYFHESSEDVARKVEQLLIHNISPIVCIGETKEQYEKGETEAVLAAQLAPVVTTVIDGMLRSEFMIRSFVIAYEPVWAIGTGNTPTSAQLEERFSWLSEHLAPTFGPYFSYDFLYGGSVNESNADQFLAIEGVNGLLIGGASTDFQKLKKIVSLG